ncbi:MAG: AMP-binding protein [Cyclobacteriaceae bacterium]|nr:AMP-binding protein [Cyclobacteriaceae bacterium]
MNEITINGKSINAGGGSNHVKEQTEFEQKTISFIRAYLSGHKLFTFQTSGSTGKSKEITFSKTQLQISARRTNAIFGLTPGKTVLHCLSPDYVAGKMMLVRALEGRLRLLSQTPGANPLSQLPDGKIIDFVALAPGQLDGILRESPQKLKQTKTILLGGADLPPGLEQKLQKLETQIFQSYAMTETLTHVALRQINGTDKTREYHAIPGVSFEVDDRGCLVVDDEMLGIKQLVTNDLVELVDEKTFRWKGRYDNVVNSGGIKIMLEETERNISEILRGLGIVVPFCLVSLPDEQLGEKLVLLLTQIDNQLLNRQQLEVALKEKLPKYHAPKIIQFVPKLYLTNTGKIDRRKNKEVYLA